MGIKGKIAPALAATADRLDPGSGEVAVRRAKNDLATIDASSENFDRRYAAEEVRIAAPVVFETKHPDGDPVAFGKKREGVIVVFADSFVVVRGMGLGAREVKSLRASEVAVERITARVDGSDVPGLRITSHDGKPKFAVAIASTDGTVGSAAATQVRDEIVDALTS